MADPPSRILPPSPISILLQNMGLTRNDLAQRAEQMRSFLDTDSNSLHALSQQSDSNEPLPLDTRPRRRSRTGSASIASSQLRSPSPSPNPVKSEPVDKPIPPRQMDTMHIVMERKRRQMKRDRRASTAQSREERPVPQPPPPPPSDPVPPQPEVQTPHHYRYYSDRVIGTASGSQHIFDNSLSPQTPTRRGRHPFKSAGTPNRDPRTPVGRHIYSLGLPPSSRASSPTSSPSRIVNLVSSPGPMRLFPPDDEDPDDLPFSLPPGPYSPAKPDYSYAAMIGQAIIASPEHRLPLQDIYEYITTVYPYYKRGEQTWMNSVRHALSTMAVFRKVPRGKMEGKSLWAIWDCDLPCFAHGGFRKSLCADMVKQKAEQAANKPGPKKRGAMEETMARNAKRRKKTINANEEDKPNQIVHTFSPMFTAAAASATSVLPPFYAPVLPGSHHQPYYQTYIPQPVPADVIFPPLPASSGYHRIANLPLRFSTQSGSRLASVDPSSDRTAGASNISGRYESGHESGDEAGNSKQATPPPDSDALVPPPSSSSAAPGLTPNTSSDSSPQMSSGTSAVGAEVSSDTESFVGAPRVADADDEFEEWLASDPATEDVDTNFSLLNKLSAKKEQERLTASVRRLPTKLSPFAVPVSPTIERKAVSSKRKEKEKEKEKEKPQQKPKAMKRSPSPSPVLRHSVSFPSRNLRPSTPPPRPCTPPRRTSTSIQLSPQRTPISHRGLHMSPSPSLAHYKNHLDPPPPAPVFLLQAPLLCRVSNVDGPLTLPSPELPRTPSRKHRTAAAGGQRPGSGSTSASAVIPPLVDPSAYAPVTPKKLFSSASASSSATNNSNNNNSNDSTGSHSHSKSNENSISTTLSPTMWDSPFRTPSKIPIFDPHDPGTILDDELMRLGSQQDSPIGSGMGIFGKERGMLYESPSLASPSWERYW